MRATGNLAGVEFIAPPLNLNYELQEIWKEIITESGYFFTKTTMQFFASRVIWDTLTKFDQETYGFITSERDTSGNAWDGKRRYTVRYWSPVEGINDLTDFGGYDTLGGARYYLTNGMAPGRLAAIRAGL
jgi:hypothetical protein